MFTPKKNNQKHKLITKILVDSKDKGKRPDSNSPEERRRFADFTDIVVLEPERDLEK